MWPRYVFSIITAHRDVNTSFPVLQLNGERGFGSKNNRVQQRLIILHVDNAAPPIGRFASEALISGFSHLWTKIIFCCANVVLLDLVFCSFFYDSIFFVHIIFASNCLKLSVGNVFDVLGT